MKAALREEIVGLGVALLNVKSDVVAEELLGDGYVSFYLLVKRA
jgi:hypothetical protein